MADWTHYDAPPSATGKHSWRWQSNGVTPHSQCNNYVPLVYISSLHSTLFTIYTALHVYIALNLYILCVWLFVFFISYFPIFLCLVVFSWHLKRSWYRNKKQFPHRLDKGILIQIDARTIFPNCASVGRMSQTVCCHSLSLAMCCLFWHVMLMLAPRPAQGCAALLLLANSCNSNLQWKKKTLIIVKNNYLVSVMGLLIYKPVHDYAENVKIRNCICTFMHFLH